MSCAECGVFFVEDTLCCALLGIECDDGIHSLNVIYHTNNANPHTTRRIGKTPP